MKTPKAKAKAKAWSAFSKFIRTRDCIKTTGTLDEGLCVTCNARLPLKKLQAGHYIQGRKNAVLFHEDLVHAQCGRCNVYMNGNLTPYALYMFNKYGQEKMEEFELLRNKTVQLKEHDYLEIEKEYKERTKSLVSLSLRLD